MVMATLYKWDDAGAPQIDATASSLLTVLRKVLVEGYGSKSPLGWTISFEDAPLQRTVYRNAGGGGEVRFQPYTTPSANHVQFWGGKSFSNIDTILHQCQLDVIVTGSPAMLMDRWAIIGTQHAFYLSMWSSTITTTNSTNAGRQQTFFFGNFVGLISDDPFPFVCCGRRNPLAINDTPTSSYTTASALGGYNSDQGASSSSYAVALFVSGSDDGVVSNSKVSLHIPPLTAATTSNGMRELNGSVAAFPQGVALFVGQARGFLPGLRYLTHAINRVHGDIFDIAGAPHFPLQSVYGRGSFSAISCGEWIE